jgi:pilus assembly protein Flp/PilA
MCIRFMSDQSGATSIEYALIAVLIAVVIVVSLQALGGGLIGVFATVTAGFG